MNWAKLCLAMMSIALAAGTLHALERRLMNGSRELRQTLSISVGALLMSIGMMGLAILGRGLLWTSLLCAGMCVLLVFACVETLANRTQPDER